MKEVVKSIIEMSPHPERSRIIDNLDQHYIRLLNIFIYFTYFYFFLQKFALRYNRVIFRYFQVI